MIEISYQRYREARNNYEGWCTKCRAFTRDCGTEPDAEEYSCPQCGENTCMGAENAMICMEFCIPDAP